VLKGIAFVNLAATVLSHSADGITVVRCPSLQSVPRKFHDDPSRIFTVTVAESQATPVLAVGAMLGEGPVWDEREQELLFVDIIGERVHRFRPATGEHSWFRTDGPTGAVVLTEEGRLLLALHDRFVYSSRSGENQVVVEGFQADGAVLRFNDGKVDPWGRFLVGTMDRQEAQPNGTLYMLSADHSVASLVEKVSVSNGLAWTADNTTLYYIDTPTRRVDAFDVDPDIGTLSARRTVVEVRDGKPDGMTIDDEGCLWVAIWDGGRVDRYAPSGELLEILRVPEGGHVTSAAFGGPTMSTLFVTTARAGLSDGELAHAPHAGDLFAYEAPITGPPGNRFQGSPDS
jgi:sugar lactone lactonase YvrE